MKVPCSRRVEAGPKRVLDSLGRAAVAGDFAVVVMGLGDDGRHLLEGHAERVVVGRVGRGRVAGGIGLDPLDAILDELAHGPASLVGAVDQEDQALHAELQVLGVPVHQSARATDLAPAGGQPRAGDQVFLDRLLEPHVDIVQAAAAAGRRVAAFEREPGVARGQDRHVFDGILDVEVGQLGDVEIGGMEMGLDQAGHDRPAAGIDAADVGRDRGRAAGRPGIGDLAVLDQHGRIRDRRARRSHSRAGRSRSTSLPVRSSWSRPHHWGLLTATIESPIRCI